MRHVATNGWLQRPQRHPRASTASPRVALCLEVLAVHRATTVAVFSALVAGCGGSQHTSGVLVEPTIKVLDAGAEPRQHLHYELTPHVPERVELTFRLRVDGAYTNTVSGTGHRSAEFPTIKSTVRIEVAALDADGIATVNSIVEDVAVLDGVVDPTIHRMVDVEVKAMKGWQGSWRMAPSGRISDVAASAPNGPARSRLVNVADTMRGNAVMFPDQAVGVGASWQATSRYVLSGVTWDKTTTYRLKALTDSSATVDAETSMRADPQALRVEPNASTRLTSATANATAELVVPLRSLVATATSRGTSEMNLLFVWGRSRLTSSVQTENISSSRPITGTGTQP